MNTPTDDTYTALRRAKERTRSARRRRLIAYGRWRPYADYADTGPIRDHIRALMAAKIGWRTIAARSGVAPTVVCSVLYPTKSGSPAARIRAEAAAAILAVQANPRTIADGALVDPTGTIRRLQALVAIGHSQAELARRLGSDPRNSTRLFNAKVVPAIRARAVVALYAELSSTDGGSIRARAHAAAHGWEPPIAWDDDTIDDPDAHPAGTFTADVARVMRGDLDVPLYEDTGADPGAPPLRAVTVEAIRRLAADGLIDREISDRLGGRLGRKAIATIRSRHQIPAGSTHRKATAE